MKTYQKAAINQILREGTKTNRWAERLYVGRNGVKAYFSNGHYILTLDISKLPEKALEFLPSDQNETTRWACGTSENHEEPNLGDFMKENEPEKIVPLAITPEVYDDLTKKGTYRRLSAPEDKSIWIDESYRALIEKIFPGATYALGKTATHSLSIFHEGFIVGVLMPCRSPLDQ